MEGVCILHGINRFRDLYTGPLLLAVLLVLASSGATRLPLNSDALLQFVFYKRVTLNGLYWRVFYRKHNYEKKKWRNGLLSICGLST